LSFAKLIETFARASGPPTGGGGGATGVVVVEGRRLRNLSILELPGVLGVGCPLAVRRFVMAHEQEGSVFRSVLEELDGEIGDDVCDVAIELPAPAHLDEVRVHITPWPGRMFQ
jgi:hypothetical protein